MKRYAVTSAVLVVLAGCTHRLAPVVKYCLPPTAFVPVASAGIRDASPDFASVFCKVKDGEFKDQYPKNCYEYVSDSAPKTMPAAVTEYASDEQMQRYRVFLVSGFASACFRDALLYDTPLGVKDSVAHLHVQHGVDVETLDLPGLLPVENEGQAVLDQLKAKANEDNRKWIVLGYSKGAVDLQWVLLQAAKTDPQVRERIAALITVAGMIGGSRLYDQVPDVEQLVKFAAHFPLWNCKPGERDVRSLNRKVRQDFLTENWQELAKVPTYSLTTVSERQQTSKVLQPVWDTLSVYGVDQDSQMAQAEQIAPGGTFLGTARADHWAVAITFPKNSITQTFVDKGDYPRQPLLEALIRFVVEDVERKTAVKPGTTK